MKRKRKPNVYNASKTKQGLLARIHILMIANLADEAIGRHAFHVLKNAEKFGIKFQNHAQEGHGCGLCLYLSLVNASREMEAVLQSESELAQVKS